jgi:hypothetical protein
MTLISEGVELESTPVSYYSRPHVIYVTLDTGFLYHSSFCGCNFGTIRKISGQCFRLQCAMGSVFSLSVILTQHLERSLNWFPPFLYSSIQKE